MRFFQGFLVGSTITLFIAIGLLLKLNEGEQIKTKILSTVSETRR